MLGRDRGELFGIVRGHVLGGDVPVVGVQETGQVADGLAQRAGRADAAGGAAAPRSPGGPPAPAINCAA